MPTSHHRSRLPAAALLRAFIASLALTGLPAAWAQAPATGTSSTATARLSADEREWMEDLAHANLAVIDTGRLALDKSQNTRVRSFAQQMVDEHQRAQQELQQLAQQKQIALPSEADFQHKAIATALRLLSGELFDKQYIRQAGVNDHRRSVDLLQKVQRSAQDPELKALAGQLLPTVQRHLEMAREMDRQMR